MLPLSIDEIYKGYFDTAVHIALPYVKDVDTAKDIAQESMIKIWESRDSFDEGKSKFFTWLKKIVVNTSIDRLRRVYVDRNSSQEDYHNDLFTEQPINIETLDLIDNLHKIRLKYRVPIYLMYIEGETQEAISKRLNIPIPTVKSQVKIALRELRKIYIETNK